MPPIVGTILIIINAALSAVPQIQGIYAEARKLIRMLFEGGIITFAEQEKLMTWASEHEATTLAGQKPPELVIDPDPVP